MTTQPNAKPKPSVDAERADIRTGKPSAGLQQKKGEIGGPKGPEPTRYGDWEVNGRCSDF
ncbi:MAG: succinate dehydrogenase assembly factor 4 [Pseudomonadota bacterium]